MANPALGASATAGGYGTSFTTTAVATQASGSSFVVFVAGNAAINAPTDSAGNTYVLKGSGTYTDNSNTFPYSIYVALNGTGSSTHTVTASEASTGNSLVVLFIEIKNAATLQALPTPTSSTGSATVTCPAVTPSAVPAYILSLAANLSDAVYSAPTDGFSIVAQLESGDSQMTAASAGIAVTTSVSYQTAMTLSVSEGWTANTLVFTGGATFTPQPVKSGGKLLISNGKVLTGALLLMPLSWTINRRNKRAAERLGRRK